MIGIVALLAWFGSGAIGAWAGTRHFQRMLDTTETPEIANVVTFVMGPIGLCGALLFIGASSRK